MKIVQFQAMENNATWQGCILGLGDDGVLYSANSHDNKWETLIEEPAEKAMPNLSDYLPNRAVKILADMDISTPTELVESSIGYSDVYKQPACGRLTTKQIIETKGKLQLFLNN